MKNCILLYFVFVTFSLMSGCSSTYYIRPVHAINIRDNKYIDFASEDDNNLLFEAKSAKADYVVVYYVNSLKDKIKDGAVFSVNLVQLFEKYLGVYQYDKEKGMLRLIYKNPIYVTKTPFGSDLSWDLNIKEASQGIDEKAELFFDFVIKSQKSYV